MQYNNGHCGIMVFSRPLYLVSLILPRAIGITDRIFTDSVTLLFATKKRLPLRKDVLHVKLFLLDFRRVSEQNAQIIPAAIQNAIDAGLAAACPVKHHVVTADEETIVAVHIGNRG